MYHLGKSKQESIGNLKSPYTGVVKAERVAHGILTAKKWRSRQTVIIFRNYDLVAKWLSKFAQSSGAKTALARVESDSADNDELRYALRSLSPNVIGTICILGIVSKLSDDVIMQSYQKIGIGLRSRVLMMNGLTDEEFEEQCQYFSNSLPNIALPVIGRYAPKIYESVPNTTKESVFVDTSAYTHFMREITTAFLSCVRQDLDRKSPGCYSDVSTTNVMNVVGYNPQYVSAALRNGLRANFYEKELEKSKKNLILPGNHEDISHDKLQKRDMFIKSNGQMKLQDIDEVAFSLSTQVLYLGAHPAQHLRGMKFPNTKVIYVDPSLTKESMEYLLATSPEAGVSQTAFPYTVEAFESLCRNLFDLGKTFVIIDDTWVPGISDYKALQYKKFKFVEKLLSSGYKVTAFMKINYDDEIVFEHAYALLPQPHGGDLSEMRLVLSHAGSPYKYNPVRVRDYMNAFHKLPIDAQRRYIAYYHRIIVDYSDVMKDDMLQKAGTLVSALFSITNASNDRAQVLRWLQSMSRVGAYVVLTVPNVHRHEVIKKAKYTLGLDVKTAGNILTYTSPHRKSPWRDYYYTEAEMYDAGYMKVTVEALAGYVAQRYDGIGYFTNSDYVDLFDVYIPIHLAKTIFKIQTIGTSPIGLVKSVTNKILNSGVMLRSQYYLSRGELAKRELVRLGIDESSISVIGTEHRSIIVTERVELDTEYGPLTITAGTGLNISGHVLSMCAADHFMPTSINLWILQMLLMTTSKDPNGSAAYKMSPLQFVDNKFTRDGKFAKWHSLNELVLTMLILEEYMKMMLGDMASSGIVNDVRTAFKRAISTAQ